MAWWKDGVALKTVLRVGGGGNVAHGGCTMASKINTLCAEGLTVAIHASPNLWVARRWYHQGMLPGAEGRATIRDDFLSVFRRSSVDLTIVFSSVRPSQRCRPLPLSLLPICCSSSPVSSRRRSPSSLPSPSPRPSLLPSSVTDGSCQRCPTSPASSPTLPSSPALPLLPSLSLHLPSIPPVSPTLSPPTNVISPHSSSSSASDAAPSSSFLLFRIGVIPLHSHLSITQISSVRSLCVPLSGYCLKFKLSLQSRQLQRPFHLHSPRRQQDVVALHHSLVIVPLHHPHHHHTPPAAALLLFPASL